MIAGRRFRLNLGRDLATQDSDGIQLQLFERLLGGTNKYVLIECRRDELNRLDGRDHGHCEYLAQ
ncbi:hypothetical protein CHELA1G11_21324 [Hyphomicrobiales bacterium]|nr:hypothetical protein CHELA1G11_21324 [Hyphomicrobiales bacterium]